MPRALAKHGRLNDLEREIMAIWEAIDENRVRLGRLRNEGNADGFVVAGANLEFQGTGRRPGEHRFTFHSEPCLVIDDGEPCLDHGKRFVFLATEPAFSF